MAENFLDLAKDMNYRIQKLGEPKESRRHIIVKLLNTNHQEENNEISKRKMTPDLMKVQKMLNDGRFLFRNHGSQKETLIFYNC